MWGCIYLLSNELGETYIGSTIDWRERMRRHKIKKTINMDCLWYWDFLEEGEYENENELRQKEQEYIKQNPDCINKTKYKGKKVCDREDYLRNKEARNAYMKQWRGKEESKDKKREYNKKYWAIYAERKKNKNNIVI